MSDLEKYIKENKNNFEEEPAANHFQRFKQKMKHKTRKRRGLQWTFTVAASLLLIVTAGIFIRNNQNQDLLISDCESAENMKICYIEKMNAVANRIELLTKDFDEMHRQELLNDVQNLIEEASGNFDKELPEELPEDKARAILSYYYKQNLESLEMIEEKLSIRN